MLKLEDFKKVNIGQELYYLSLETEEYEVTLEPHLSAGFTVAIYSKRDPILSIHKRTVWKFNHPKTEPIEPVQRELLDRALEVAEYYHTFYVQRNTEELAPWIKKRKHHE